MASIFKEKSNRKLLLERYVDNLQQKDLNKQDVQLLNVTGNTKVVEILNEFSKKKQMK